MKINSSCSFKENVLAMMYGEKNTKLVVLGHQKSGTTVIGNLISKATGLSYSNDPTYAVKVGDNEIINQFYHSPSSFYSLSRSKKSFFYQQIVKDPEFTLNFELVSKLYPNADFVFIARSPHQTIRSIFNRLKLDGTLDSHHVKISEMYNGNQLWSFILNGEENDYTVVENLARRIEKCTENYLENKDKMYLVRYEDFVKNKSESIFQIVNNLSLEQKYDIDSFVDVQYQPKGNVETDLNNFFGNKNYHKIANLCPKTMKTFSYTY
jgi:hypothetical protein